MMSQVITVPVTAFTSHDKLAQALNQAVADKNVQGIFFNKTSLTKGAFEILVDENTQQVIRTERPSKFKADATSQYYCVYERDGKWTYKFVRKGEVYNGKRYDTEIEAALAYDKHVFEIDGHALKTNFPERFQKVVK